jgi:Ca-activated chloride channel family protein
VTSLLGVLVLSALIGEQPRFSVKTEQVRLDVVVSRGGKPVSGLTAEDFEVLDDGVPQRFRLLSRDESAVHGVLALDLSTSVEAEERARLKDAAASFLRALQDGDRATVLAFTQDVYLVSGPGNPAAVLSSLTELDDSGGTALYDAVYTAMTVAEAATGRPFVLVFTDGEEQVSWMDGRKLLEIARGLGATVYVVSPRPWPAASSTTGAQAMSSRESSGPASADLLLELVRETGGRLWSDSRPERFEHDFAQVLTEVKSRYLLAYEVQGAMRPGWHRVEVKLKKGHGDVRTRRGYFAMP